MPRHPPCALRSLPNTNTQQKQQRHTTKTTPTQKTVRAMLASTIQKSRCTDQPGQPRSIHPQAVSDASDTQQRARNHPPPTHPAFHAANGCSTDQESSKRAVVRRRLHYPNTTRCPTRHSLAAACPNRGGCVLLRKEVIQPHLPVRLPCYDFVPIASPTFDHSPPNGLGHGLRVLPTFVT
jgi:hypothetical protein